jgi:hypothetical protein
MGRAEGQPARVVTGKAEGGGGGVTLEAQVGLTALLTTSATWARTESPAGAFKSSNQGESAYGE